jgi:hypothetical protein
MHVCRAAAAAVILANLLRAQPAARPAELDRAISVFKTESGNLGLRTDGGAAVKAAGTQSQKPRWHGRLFENFRNNFLDAVPHEVVQRGGEQGLLRRSQFGFNLTGPVVIPKIYNGARTTFFTFTFEGVREKIGRSYLRTIPTVAERRGDWSASVDASGVTLPIYDPASTARNPAFNDRLPVSGDNLEYLRSPFPGNRIPDHRLDPTAQRVAAHYPAPNSDAGPFFRNNLFVFAPEINSANGTIARVDHTVNDKNRLAFNLNNSTGTDGAAPLIANAANPGSVIVDRRSRRVSLEHVLTASSRNVNTLSFAASTSQFAYRGEGGEGEEPFPYFRVTPYLSLGRSYPASRSARNSFTLNDGFSTRRGAHRLALSGSVTREQVNIFSPRYPSGLYQFSAGFTSLPGIINTGHAFASFLLGDADYAERSIVTSPSYFRKSHYTVTVRDQWEMRKGLTLSVAVTLDGSSPRTEKYDRQSTVSTEVLNPENGRPGALIVAGGNRRGFQPFLWNAQPSANLSWNVMGDSKTVARASYGRSYSVIPIYTSQWGTQAFNGVATWISPNMQLQPAVTLAQGLAPTRSFPDTRLESANYTIADLVEMTGRQPTYESAGLSVERSMAGQMILTMGAGHANGRNLLLGNSGSNPNAIPLSALQFRDDLNNEAFRRELRPYPQYQRFDVYSAWPEGRYRRDATYVRFEKRSSSGLSLSAYYEFSKQMDNYSGPYGIQDYYHRENEWSLTSSNNPHRISFNYVYELPFGPNRLFFTAGGWQRHVFEGWSLSGVTTMTSGEPLALRPQFNNTGGVLDVLNVNVVPGVAAHVANQSPERWFNPEAFAQPDDFSLGNASRTHPSLRMPSSQNHDLSVNKRFSITTERSIELTAVGLNFVNLANWTDPDTMIGPANAPNVNAGRIIGSRGGRVIQLGLRYSF